MTDNDKFKMVGTEGTGDYVVVVSTNRAKVGYRDLGGGAYRVRVEPLNASAMTTLVPSFPAPDWKQPGEGDQPRFSCVTPDAATMREKVIAAVKAVTRFARVIDVNPDASDWAKEAAEKKS